MRVTWLVACGLGCAGVATPPARSAACDVDGTWVGTATDPAGAAWALTMLLHQDGKVLGGTTEWQGGDGRRALEDVRGVVECRAGRISLHSITTDGAPTAYRLELAADDAAVTGRFEGESGRPGTIQARRK